MYKLLKEEQIGAIIGGYDAGNCFTDIGLNTLTMTGQGALYGSAAPGWGTIGGGFLGAHIGVIAGSAICAGNLIGGK